MSESPKEGLVPFNIKNEFDQNTYAGRFMKQYKTLNPLLFFYSNQQIREAQKKVLDYSEKLEAAERSGVGHVLMKPEDVEDIKMAHRIVGGSVHPDTGELIPRVMRLSGFVVFNIPLATLMVFAPNQTPFFTGTM